MLGHGQHSRSPVSAVLLDGDDACFLIVHVVALELMHGKSDSGIHFVIDFSHNDLVLHRNITVFLSRQALALGSQLSQCATNAETCVARFDYIIDVTILGCLIRISEEL